MNKLMAQLSEKCENKFDADIFEKVEDVSSSQTLLISSSLYDRNVCPLQKQLVGFLPFYDSSTSVA